MQHPVPLAERAVARLVPDPEHGDTGHAERGREMHGPAVARDEDIERGQERREPAAVGRRRVEPKRPGRRHGGEERSLGRSREDEDRDAARGETRRHRLEALDPPALLPPPAGMEAGDARSGLDAEPATEARRQLGGPQGRQDPRARRRADPGRDRTQQIVEEHRFVRRVRRRGRRCEQVQEGRRLGARVAQPVGSAARPGQEPVQEARRVVGGGVDRELRRGAP